MMFFSTFFTNMVYFSAVESKVGVRTEGLPQEIYVPGEVIIGGLFPVHYKGNGTPCGEIMEGRGVHRVMAMLYAIERINNDSTLLPGIKVGARILDTCSQPNYALNMSLYLVKNLMLEGQASRFVCPLADTTPTMKFLPSPLIGVVGASYSSVSTMVANLLRLFEVVQISPASTNADLSDKTKYEYFARTVPSDVFQSQVLADIVAYFSWTYVSLVHSEGEYGRLGADRFKEAARARNVCLAYEGKIFDGANVTEIVQNLKDKSLFWSTELIGARAVVLFTRNDDTRTLLLEMKRQGLSGVQWIAADGWETTTDKIVHGVEDVAGGALVVTLAYSELRKVIEFIKAFDPRLSKYSSPWFLEWWETRFECALRPETYYTYGRPCTAADRFSKDIPIYLDDKVEFSIDAVYALAHALHKAWMEKCDGHKGPSGYGLCDRMLSPGHSTLASGSEFYEDYLLNVSFSGISGTNFHFSPEGDGPPNYVVKAFLAGNQTYQVVGVWNNSHLTVFNAETIWGEGTKPFSRCATDCSRGKRKVMHGGSTCCWVCVDCPANAVLKGEFDCSQCKPGYWPNARKETCYNIVHYHLEKIEWSSAYAVVPSILAGIGLICNFIVVYIFLRNNDTPIVKASGRELSYTLLAGIAICYLCTYVILAHPSVLVCTLRRLMIGLGFVMLYSALLVKTNRIYRIFDSARRSARRPRFISPRSQLVITSLFVLVQLVGSLVWIGVVPPGSYYDYPDPQPQAVLKCNSDNNWFLLSMVYIILLILVCTGYGIATRMVPENFNETKFIGFTMYTTCVIWLAFGPIHFGTGNDFRIQTMTLCISISLSASVALVLLYSPKIYVIYWEPEKNMRKATGVPSLSTNTTVQPSMYSPLISKQCSPNAQTFINRDAVLTNRRESARNEIVPAASYHRARPSIDFSMSGDDVAL